LEGAAADSALEASREEVLAAFPEVLISTLAVLAPVVDSEAAILVPVLASPFRDQPITKKQNRRMTMMTMTRKIARQMPTLGTHSLTLGRMKYQRASCKTTCNVAERLAMSWLKTYDDMACGYLGQLSCFRRNWLHWAW
jgi:hypothetical protein